MDYKAFFAEVAEWIQQCNSMAIQHGMHSNEFWTWVFRSTGEMSNKYKNNDLVKKQIIMLVNWLEDIYEKSKS